MANIPSEYTDFTIVKRQPQNLHRAKPEDLEKMLDIYATAMQKDDSGLLCDYPSAEQVRKDIEDQVLWYSYYNDQIEFAVVLTGLEPTFKFEWDLEIRYDLGRMPGDNWFRPGPHHITMLRFASIHGYGENHALAMADAADIAVKVAHKHGINEVRARTNCDRVWEGRAMVEAFFHTMAYTEKDERGQQYYGHIYRYPYAKFEPESSRWILVAEDHDADSYKDFDPEGESRILTAFDFGRMKYSTRAYSKKSRGPEPKNDFFGV